MSTAVAGTLIFFMGFHYPAGWAPCTPKETAALTRQWMGLSKVPPPVGGRCLVKLPRPQ